MDVSDCVLSAGRAVLDMVGREWQPLSSGELEQRLDLTVEELLEAELMALVRAQRPMAVHVHLSPSQAHVGSQASRMVAATCGQQEVDEAAEPRQSVNEAAVKYITELLNSSKSQSRLVGRARLSLSHTILLSLALLTERVSYGTISHRFSVEKGNIHKIFFSFCEHVNLLEEKLIRWPVDEEAVDALFPLSSQEKGHDSGVSGLPHILGVLGRTRVPIRPPTAKNHGASTVPQAKRTKKEANPDSWLNLELVSNSRGRLLHCRISRGLDDDRGSALRERLKHNPQLMPPGSCLVARADYPLTTHILTPYTVPHGAKEELFNKTLEEHFRILDQAVANLKARFQRLTYLDIGNYDRARSVVLTACVLHNAFLDIGHVVQGELKKGEVETQEVEVEVEDKGVCRREEIAELLYKASESKD